MKNSFLLICAILIAETSYAQWNSSTSTNGIYYNSGSVGVGITNPSYPIHIRHDDGLSSGLHNLAKFTRFDSGTGNAGFSLRYESNGNASTRTIMNFPGGIGVTFQVYNGGSYDALHIHNDGNIGIGTISPNHTLEVDGTGNFAKTLSLAPLSTGGLSFGHNWRTYAASSNSLYITKSGTNGAELEIKDVDGSVNNSEILVKGKIGIGTTSIGSYKLAVNGSIRSKEVKVEANWSDFVFYDNYQLRTLEEVEEHINENGHLPEIPSEAEVTENGINLGEMNAKLLQKIEELTLYLIEQNKENHEQQKLIEELQKEVSALKNE